MLTRHQKQVRSVLCKRLGFKQLICSFVCYWLMTVVVWLAQRYNQGRLVILRCRRVSGTWRMPVLVIPCFIYCVFL